MTKKGHRLLGTSVWIGASPRQELSEDLSTGHFGPVAITVAPLAREEAQNAWNSPVSWSAELGCGSSQPEKQGGDSSLAMSRHPE